MLTKFELLLWIASFSVVLLSFLLSPATDYLTLAASLIGVTSLIFVAKGMAFGQFLIIIFALLYGIASWMFTYYGEMITYVFMSAPAALASLIAWLRNPYGESGEVAVNRKRITGTLALALILMTLAVTVAFYFILDFLGTANLLFSTLSVSTSFLAATLTFIRNPYYAIAYAANDIVLIVLWILAARIDVSYVPMIFCFVAFLANDIYGFINWKRMKKRQANG